MKKNSRKIREKREKMLQRRLEKAEDFRIDYMPLCMDEDMEAMSEFYREKNKKKGSFD